MSAAESWDFAMRRFPGQADIINEARLAGLTLAEALAAAAVSLANDARDISLAAAQSARELADKLAKMQNNQTKDNT